MKRIKKTTIRVKFELEAAIKVFDSKNVEIVSVMKEVESVVKIDDIKQLKFQQISTKQKRLFEIWVFFIVGKPI